MPRRRAEEYPLRVTSRPPDSTPPRDDSELEDAVRSALDAKDVDGAVTHILRGLGPELLGFMIALTRDPAAAGDAFSELSVDIWRVGHIPLSQASVVSKVAVEVREASLQRIEALHDAFADIRSQLDEDDQVILVLRVDRSMGWRDIARVIAEGDTDADVDRVAATLRKRFERIKTRIRELTQAARPR